MEQVVIPRRFTGPAKSGNGGYSCGAFALGAGLGPATVTLHLPPPLETALLPEADGEKVRFRDGGALVATVEPAGLGVPAEPAVSWAEAHAAQARFPGRDFHPFPHCFVCGTERDDGLEVHPGLVGERTVACTWQPDASVAGADGLVGAEIVWAALDCPGGWTGDLAVEPMVLGRMTARVNALPVAGDDHVLIGRSEPPAGRKVVSHTALYGSGGVLLAAASAIWIIVPAGDAVPAAPG